MSKEFNYQRAWKEFVQPEYKKLCEFLQFTNLYHLVEKHVDGLNQDGARHALLGEKVPHIIAMFDCMPVEQLAWASQVVYFYGHLASNRAAQESGLYWKFQMLADTSLINREKVDCSKPLSTSGLVAMHDSKVRMDKALKAFHDHKEGTEYDDEEATEILVKVAADGVSVLRVDHVNHKPDMFCIGPKHFKNDSMYLDPTFAPCAHCGEPYSAHTSDRVVFVKVHNPDDKDKIQGALVSLKDACEASTIKIDGFALVK